MKGLWPWLAVHRELPHLRCTREAKSIKECLGAVVQITAAQNGARIGVVSEQQDLQLGGEAQLAVDERPELHARSLEAEGGQVRVVLGREHTESPKLLQLFMQLPADGMNV